MFNLKNKNDKTKRAITSVLAFALMTQISSGAVQAFTKESGTESNKLKVAVLSDPHYFPEEYVTNRDNEQYKDYMAKELYLLAESAEILEAALKMVAEDKPDFLLIPGDMTKNGESLGTERVAQILNDFEKQTGIDVFIINGNHDIYDHAFAFNGENGDRNDNIPVVSASQYLSLYGNFGYSDENEVNDIVYFGDNEGEVSNTIHPELSYITRLKDGYVLLSLNSQLYATDENGDVKQAGGGFNEDLLQWAEKQIKEAKANGDTVIAMSHHGIVTHSLASELSEGSAVVNNYEDVATRLADAGLRYVFTGHMHENDIAEWTTAKGNTLYDIETGATAGYGAPVRTVEFEKAATTKNDETSVKETVTVSSKSVKSTENIEDLQQYMYDFIYKDSKYLEIKLGGALDSIVSKLENLNLYDLIFGESNLSNELNNIEELKPVVELMKNDTLTEEERQEVEAFDMAKELSTSFGEALNGKKLEIDGQGTCTLKYDEEKDEILVLSNSRIGIEDILAKLNVEATLKDVVKQIDDNVLEPGVLQGEVRKVINSILNMEVYVTDTAEKKVLNDVVNLFLVDHFLGAEDLSGWPQELLDKLAEGEGVKGIIDKLLDSVLGILPEILKKTTVDAKVLTDDKLLQTGINLLLMGKDKSYNKLLSSLGVDVAGIIKKPINKYLESYITPSFERQMGTLIGNLIHELAGDDTQDDKIDGQAREITYTGVVPQEPTVENGLLPHSIAVTFGADETTEKAFSWFTGKNVPNNELQIVKASEAKMKADGEVDFTNATVIEADSEIVKRSFPTVDLGLIAITKDKEVSRHQVLLTGLQSGTEYYYRVGNSENGIYSDVATFETAAVNNNNFTFINFGDTQAMLESEYEIWETVFDTAFDMYPEAKFVTHAGDMVDNGKNELQWQWFLNKPQEDLMNTTFVGASGNHEEYADFSHTDHFNIQDVPEQDLTTGAYYKVDYGNALIMVLNTNNLGEDNGLTQDQIEWLRETANNSDAKWKIIQTHKGSYTNGSHYSDEDVVAIRAQLDELTTELGIDFVLQGHDHTYARSEYLVNGEVESELVKEDRVVDGVNYETAINPEGTIYAITGTSAVKFYTPQETGLPLAYTPVVEDPIFAAITIENDTLYYNAYTVNPVDGQSTILDTFAIEKSAVEADIVAPTITGVENGGSYYVDRTVIASDNEGLESVTINGVEVSGNYEIVASNEAKEYVVIATDKSGNTSEIRFTMAALPTVDDITLGEASLTLINNIKAEFEAMRNTLYSDRVVYYTNLIEALEEAYEICEAVIKDFVGKVEELPAVEEVTAEHVKEIKGVLAIYRSLNEEERAALGEEVISRIEALEQAIKVESLVTEDNNVLVEVIGGGHFDLGTVITTSVINGDEEGIFEINATLDGVEAEINGDGKIKVSISLGGFTYDENYKLYLISKDRLIKTEILTTVVDGKLVFETDKLGKFAIVKIATSEELSNLTSLIEKAESIDTDKYTTNTVNALREALEKAKEVLGRENVTSKEVLAVVEELNIAIDGLEEKVVIAPEVNKSELAELIEKLSTIDTKLYTDETVKMFTTALNSAKEVLSNEASTQDEVNKAIKALRAAVDGLVQKEDINSGNGNGGNTGSGNNGSGSGSGNGNGGSGEGNNGSGNGNGGTNTGSGNNGATNDETNNLPQTGGTNSILVVTLGVLTTLGGALSLKKRK